METTPNVVGKFICDMPVLFGRKSSTYSYGMGITATVFMYYICSSIYMAAKNNGASGGVIAYTMVGFIVFTLIQGYFLYIQAFYKKCNVTLGGMGISVAVGVVIGIIVFGVTAGVAPSYLPYVPTQVESFTPLALNGGLGTKAPASVVKDDASSAPDKSEKKCGAPNENDDFVCDLYKNGQLVTSTISE